MKVLQINSVCGIGSTGRIATDIHDILIEQGHESYIAYGRDLPKNCDNTIRIGTKFDNYTHVTKTRFLDRHGFGSKRATIKFIETVKVLDPDIIHLHNIHGYYINIEVLFNYLKEAGKPVIWTLHDCWSFTGHCSHFDYIGCNRWKTGCFDCPQKKEYPKSLLLDDSKRNYKEKREIFTGIKDMKIVTPSKWLARLAKDSYLKDYEVITIHNGIDLSIFKPTKTDFRDEYNLQNKFIILGVASTWTDRKGFAGFLELSLKLEKDEVIVLVGVSQYQINQLPNNIIGIKKTNSIKELAEIYTSAAVFVNLTLEEVLGLTNIEALACGIPVITYNTGGSKECIDKSTGILVEQENLGMVIKGIRSIRNNSKVKSPGLCRKRALTLFEKSNNYKDYISIYRNRLFIES